MFVRITKSKNTQNVYIVEGYRDKNGKSKQRIVEKWGRLDELIKQDKNIMQKLRKRAKDLTKENDISITVTNYRKISESKKTQNYGYFYMEKIYNALGIKDFLQKANAQNNFKYDINKIMKMLVFSRILKPASKFESFKNQDAYFKPFTNKLVDIYRSLSVMNKIKNDIQKVIHQKIEKSIGRDLSLVLYDLTNYYFETEKEDNFKKPGVSKEKKTNPIVQMGLLIDKNKIPVGYELFPGNTHDSKTLIQMTKKLKAHFGVQRMILTADKGINTHKNLASLIKQGDGYIVSQKVRGSKKEFINEVLNEKGYTKWGDSFKLKEIYQTRNVQDENKNDVTLKEKVIIYWSRNFDQREKYKRQKLAEKIENLLKNPSALNASNAHGIKRYIRTKHFDKTTGEIKKINPVNVFNYEKYERDIALDGYYAIVTSEINQPAIEILAHYKELWKIEESFKVIKSDLEGRPVHVRREDQIQDHFLICFIALTILRILELKLNYKYSVSKIRKSLNNSKCKEFTNGFYTIEPLDEVMHEIQKIFDMYIYNAIMSSEQLRKLSKAGNTTFF